jgi:hypothetical protein
MPTTCCQLRAERRGVRHDLQLEILDSTAPPGLQLLLIRQGLSWAGSLWTPVKKPGAVISVPPFSDVEGSPQKTIAVYAEQLDDDLGIVEQNQLEIEEAKKDELRNALVAPGRVTLTKATPNASN